MEEVLNIFQYLTATKPKTFAFLSLIGFLLVLKKVIKRIRSFYRVLLRPRRDLLKRYGPSSWVLVTGSSDGIGKQFALSFAKRQFNIILAARTQSKLKKVAEEIYQINPNLQVKIIVTDFTQSHKKGYFDEFMSTIQDLDISVLVNNVGLEFVTPYHQSKEDDVQNLVTVNTLPISVLSHRLILKFLKRKKKSAIINLASSVSHLPLAGYHVYCASKIFDDYLSRSLSYQYPQLDIMSLRPSEVSTPMTGNKPKDFMTITPSECVQAALGDLGWDKTTSGHYNHKFQNWIVSLFPESIFNVIFKRWIMPSWINERIEQEKSKGK